MSLFGGKPEIAEPESSPFFGIAESAELRMLFIWRDGFRLSLPYRHLHDISYKPDGDADSEEITLHFPGYSVLQIVGHGLFDLYEAFAADRLAWVREKKSEEAVAEGSSSIEKIRLTELREWQLDLALLEQRRAEVFGLPVTES